MGNNPSLFNDCSQCPVEQVSWDDVQLFLQKLNEETGQRYRLPTEAEWEYAARGGNRSKGYRYSGSNELKEVAWYHDNSERKTHLVGQLRANELGIYDMSGNVYEWCSDWYGENYYGQIQKGVWRDPQGPAGGKFRVARGCSWLTYIKHCRVANRNWINADLGNGDTGFRLVRD
jgi:formylglycine-generating enzyme required for sulfatase activity